MRAGPVRIVLATVRVRDYGYDILYDGRRYSTRRVVPGGISDGGHSEAETLRMLAELYAVYGPKDGER